MLLATVRYTLRCVGAYTFEYTAGLIRRHFAECDDYDKRQILLEIEVAVGVPRKEVPPSDLALWTELAEEIRPPKAPFTVDYRCGKCGARDVKLWRGWHGHADADGNELLCAACLAPGQHVDDKGRLPCDLLHGTPSDQINGWLPAVPVGDTYWGYTSVPTADCRWWSALPTYAATDSNGEEPK